MWLRNTSRHVRSPPDFHGEACESASRLLWTDGEACYSILRELDYALTYFARSAMGAVFRVLMRRILPPDGGSEGR